ncbi:MAG TPA: response regulator transcription factor [Ramlibacter sp.]|nr:response regulator transcription factor [Ramlibacter sp.]
MAMVPASANIPLKVFLVDDSLAIRERVAQLLAGPGLAIVGQASAPQDSITGILAARPDVVVLDVQLDGGTGLDVLRAVQASAPGIAFVVFSNHCAAAYRKRYLGAGAAGFLDKSSDFAALAGAVRAAGSATAH